MSYHDKAEIGNKLIDKRTASAYPSPSVVSIHLALNATLPCLQHHTMFLSSNYKKSWNTVDSPNTATFDPDAFNFYVHAPSRTDDTVCPIGIFL